MQFDVADRQASQAVVRASDVSAILNINPWKSALDVYIDKIGQGTPIVENQKMHWGQVLEQVVADEFTFTTGKKLRRDNKTLYHPELPYLCGHIDRKVEGTNEIFEAKCTGFADGWGESGSDQIPPIYLSQVSVYMAIKNAARCFVAVLIGGNDFRIYTIERDLKVEDMIKNKVSDFWFNNVKRQIPPEAKTNADMERLYNKAGLDPIIPDASILTALAQRKEKAAEIKSIETDIKELDMVIKAAHGDHDALITEQGKVLSTWKLTTTNRFDAKAFKESDAETHSRFIKPSSYRRLLIK